jgi:hypothetical protein
MTRKTITKFFIIVISFLAISCIFSGCSSPASGNSVAAKSRHYDKPRNLGNIADPSIVESSGLAASKCQPNVLWTHNDSGDDAFIYALTPAGASLGTWRVPGAENIDWEDIAEYKDGAGKCFIYIGEIGDNDAKRAEHLIYRVREPGASTATSGSTKAAPLQTEAAEVLRFIYPDGPHDAETLMVHPKTADIYVVTKHKTGPAGVYRLHSEFGNSQPVQAEKIAPLSVPGIPMGLLTGGDISPDGRRMIICDYTAGYEYTLPEGTSNFDDIWKLEPEMVDIGDRRVGEAVCYSADGNTLYSTSEGKHQPIFGTERRH